MKIRILKFSLNSKIFNNVYISLYSLGIWVMYERIPCVLYKLNVIYYFDLFGRKSSVSLNKYIGKTVSAWLVRKIRKRKLAQAAIRRAGKFDI